MKTLDAFRQRCAARQHRRNNLKKRKAAVAEARALARQRTGYLAVHMRNAEPLSTQEAAWLAFKIAAGIAALALLFVAGAILVAKGL